MTKVDLFDYELPEDLIAAAPAQRRDESRLLALDRRSGRVGCSRFCDLPELLRQDDLLVLNDARVMPARLRARRKTGGAVEILLVRPEPVDDSQGRLWLAIVRSGGRLQEGEALAVDGLQSSAVLMEKRGGGYWLLSVCDKGASPDAIWEAGVMPLPPYVIRARRRRALPAEMPELDRERYQTVFARCPGAVAAPTAGLHFTRDLLDRIAGQGVEVRTLSLLIGPGTFMPVRAENVEDHRLAAEFFHMPAETAAAVAAALRDGRRVVAVGTTTCRVLEHMARSRRWEEQSGWTDLFIHPPFEFRVVGALITNFHLPRSTLLMLVAAFAGRENVLNAYQVAVQERCRFYSYGDAMFIA